MYKPRIEGHFILFNSNIKTMDILFSAGEAFILSSSESCQGLRGPGEKPSSWLRRPLLREVVLHEA